MNFHLQQQTKKRTFLCCVYLLAEIRQRRNEIILYIKYVIIYTLHKHTHTHTHTFFFLSYFLVGIFLFYLKARQIIQICVFCSVWCIIFIFSLFENKKHEVDYELLIRVKRRKHIQFYIKYNILVNRYINGRKNHIVKGYITRSYTTKASTTS